MKSYWDKLLKRQAPSTISSALSTKTLIGVFEWVLAVVLGSGIVILAKEAATLWSYIVG